MLTPYATREANFDSNTSKMALPKKTPAHNDGRMEERTRISSPPSPMNLLSLCRKRYLAPTPYTTREANFVLNTSEMTEPKETPAHNDREDG